MQIFLRAEIYTQHKVSLDHNIPKIQIFQIKTKGAGAIQVIHAQSYRPLPHYKLITQKYKI